MWFWMLDLPRETWWQKFKAGLDHAFQVVDDFEPSAEDLALLEKIANFLVVRKLETPAIMALESGRAFNFLASQAMHFFKPILSILLKTEEFQRFAKIMEHRKSIDVFIEIIENVADQKAGKSEK